MKTTSALITSVLVGLAMAGCKSKPTAAETGDAASVASAEAKASPATGLKPLPPEPPAPLAGKYDGGAPPSIAEIEGKNPALKDIWEPSRREQLRVLLTVLSTMVETLDDGATEEIPLPYWEKAKALKLDGALFALVLALRLDEPSDGVIAPAA